MLKKQHSRLTALGSQAPLGQKEKVEQTLQKEVEDYERFINEVKLADTELASIISIETASVEKIQSLLNPSTTIPFEIGGSKRVDIRISVYNLLGQKVAVLLEKQLLPGTYEVTWDARDLFGNRVPSGVYFYELLAGEFRDIHKMLLVK